MEVNGDKQQIAADPKITAYQVAARLYCKKTGDSPDTPLQIPHPQLAGVTMEMPLWYTVAERMYDLALLLRSISEQNQQPRPPNGAGKVLELKDA